MMADPDPRPSEGSSLALTVTRWTLAAVLVVAAHGLGAWIAMSWHRPEVLPNEPPSAVMIDLAPLAVAPPAPPQEVAPGPQQTEAQPEPTPDTPTPTEQADPEPSPPQPTPPIEDTKPDPTPEPAPEPAQPVQDVQPEPTPPLPPPEVKIPELPKMANAEAVLAPPPKPKPKPKKKPPPKPREVERQTPIQPDRKRVRQTTAPPTSMAQRSDDAAASSAGASSSAVSPATWKGELLAHLNRYKRFPPGASAAGTASVAFTITRSGQVLSAHLIGSSGDAALDAEAVSLPRRASPLPAPPPGVGGGGSITLTVPIRFNRY